MPNQLSSKTGWFWLWLAVIIVIIDQLSKYWATVNFSLGEWQVVFPGLNIVLVHNDGAAFSFLAGLGGWQRWFLSIVTIAICAYLLIWLKQLSATNFRFCLPLTLILGGAIGNLIDRLYLGYVIDFIDVYYKNNHWPAFNVADSCISVGVFWLLFVMITSNKKEN